MSKTPDSAAPPTNGTADQQSMGDIRSLIEQGSSQRAKRDGGEA